MEFALPCGGSGSGMDCLRERHHDRLLPPARCQGPSLAPSRRRQQADVDGDLYDALVDLVVQTTAIEGLEDQAIALVRDRAISSTRLRNTFRFFMDTLGPEDAEVIPIDIAAIKETFAHICCLDTWPFLLEPPTASHAVRDLMDMSACKGV